MMLSTLFGIKPAWFSDPTTARTMIILVNTWLGYPYMMILCTGAAEGDSGRSGTKRRQWMAPARSRTSLKLPSRCWIKPLTRR